MKWRNENMIKDNEFETLKAVIGKEERINALNLFFEELERMAI